MIYLTSDLHLNHDREFIWGARGYSNVEEMNKEQVARFNAIVQPEDECWILGDLALGSLEIASEYLRQLNGRIHVVIGNHDTDTRIRFYKSLGWDCQDAARIKYNKITFYLSHFPTICANLESETLHQTTVNLYGHTHQNTKFYQDNPYMYYVGVDAHNGYPISIEQIITDIRAEMHICKKMLEDEKESKATIMYLPWRKDNCTGIAEGEVIDSWYDFDGNMHIQLNFNTNSTDFLQQYNNGIFSEKDFDKVIFFSKEVAKKSLC